MLRVQNYLWTFHTKTVEKIQFVLFKWKFLSQINIKKLRGTFKSHSNAFSYFTRSSDKIPYFGVMFLTAVIIEKEV